MTPKRDKERAQVAISQSPKLSQLSSRVMEGRQQRRTGTELVFRDGLMRPKPLRIGKAGYPASIQIQVPLCERGPGPPPHPKPKTS